LQHKEERVKVMSDKKQNGFKSPDLSKMQIVVIDEKTRIYVDLEDDPEEAKQRYLERLINKKP
jgi:hypothetical protein